MKNKKYDWTNKPYKSPLQRQRKQNLINFAYECLGTVSLAATFALMFYFSLPVKG